MHERYDLKKMLEEIKEDEAMDKNPRNVRISQDDIQRMVERKLRKKKGGEK